MDLFRRCGIKFFTFTTKHHDGFSMWPTTTKQRSPVLTAQAFDMGCEYTETVTNHYSIMDGPYKKDIVGAWSAPPGRRTSESGSTIPTSTGTIQLLPGTLFTTSTIQDSPSEVIPRGGKPSSSTSGNRFVN